MIPSLDIWTAAALLAVLILLATLRQSIPTLAQRDLGPVVGFLTNPSWLAPLVFVAFMMCGYMLQGQLSPWPPASGAVFRANWGVWAGVTGFILTVAIDIWLVWAPSMVARRFVGKDKLGTLKNLPVFNIIFGGVVIALLLWNFNK